MSNPTLIVGFEDVMTYIKNQDQRIKELEKENHKIKDSSVWEDAVEMVKEAANKKIKKLEEENKKLQDYRTSVYNVWSDLYWAEKSGCEVSSNDIAESCDYYGHKEFVKKEIVHDSEDESDDEE